MLKKAAGTMLATLAAANINDDYHRLLHGRDQVGDMDTLWDQFVEDFSSSSPVDLTDPVREAIFLSNVKESIIPHNRSVSTYTKGINKFSAMTFKEFEDYFHLKENQENADQNCSATRSSPLTANGNGNAPDSWDWRNKGGVSPVKDQQNCGSCWTFSTVGCLESANLIKYGVLETYSEQQLVDCAGDFDNYGCNGGLPSHAFEYLFYAGGISTEAAYPYYA